MKRAIARVPLPRSRTGQQIAVAGPYRWARELLASALSRGLRVAVLDLGVVDLELLDRIGEHPPVPVVLIAEAPNPQLVQILERVHRRYPRMRLVVLPGLGPGSEIVSLVRKGVSGVLPVEAGISDLIADVRILLTQNQLACTPRVASALLCHFGHAGHGNGMSSNPKLSPRESEIAELLQHDLPNKIIADRLNISEGTVKNHIHRMLQKMAVQKRTEIVDRLPSHRPEN